MPGINVVQELSQPGAERIGEKIRSVTRPQDVVLASIHWAAIGAIKSQESSQPFLIGLWNPQMSTSFMDIPRIT
jgi:aromatic ring-opening dioxygenase catalytic subunit (LigB family)